MACLHLGTAPNGRACSSPRGIPLLGEERWQESQSQPPGVQSRPHQGCVLEGQTKRVSPALKELLMVLIQPQSNYLNTKLNGTGPHTSDSWWKREAVNWRQCPRGGQPGGCTCRGKLLLDSEAEGGNTRKKQVWVHREAHRVRPRLQSPWDFSAGHLGLCPQTPGKA